MSEYILVHSGIKGQKWGVRRFQEEDGTLTEAGKRRYSKSTTNRTIANKSKPIKTLSFERSSNKTTKTEKQPYNVYGGNYAMGGDDVLPEIDENGNMILPDGTVVPYVNGKLRPGLKPKNTEENHTHHNTNVQQLKEEIKTEKLANAISKVKEMLTTNTNDPVVESIKTISSNAYKAAQNFLGIFKKK